MKFREPKGLHRKSGMWGTPVLGGGRVSGGAVLEALGFENAAARSAYPSIPQVGVASGWGETAEPA
jgi:hypothetical protein